MAVQSSSGGRGRGRGRGRSSGRGRSNTHGRSSSSTKTNTTQKKTINDYKYVIGGSAGKTVNDFHEVTRYLLNHIQKTFVHGTDIQTALKARRDFDFSAARPTRMQSTAKDPDMRAAEDEANDAIFKAEIAQFMKRKDSYKSNQGKAYALLWQQCNRAMQNKINTRKDFERKSKVILLNC